MAMEEEEFVRIIGGITKQLTKTMQDTVISVRKQVTEMPSRSWREKKFSLAVGEVAAVDFQDTSPNYVIFTNYSDTEIMFIGSMGGLSSTNFDFKVQPKSRVQWLWGRGLDRVYLLGNGVVNVQSYEADFDPSAVVSYVY